MKSQRIRIFHLETGRHLYGGAYQVLLLLNGLHQSGIVNLLAAPQRSAIFESTHDSAQTIPLTMKGELDPRFLRDLWQALRLHQPQILHVHSRRGADWWGGLLAKRLGIPALITRRVDNPETPLIAALKYDLYDRIVAISHGVRKVLIHQGIHPSRIHVIPSAIDLSTFAPTTDQHRLRRLHNLPMDRFLVGMVAQFIPRKGHDVLLEAAPAIVRENPRVHFLLLGQGPMLEHLRSQCERSHLKPHFSFAGYRRDLHLILPVLDLLVHPARMEGLGVSLIQAAACGVPIVASAVGGIPEIVLDGYNGRLIPPERPDMLARAINDLAQDPETRAKMGANGRRLAMERFGSETMVEAYMKLYTEMLETSTMRGRRHPKGRRIEDR